MINTLKSQEKLIDLVPDSKRAILFEFRDVGFLDFKDTQDLWLDLAKDWGVENHLPHLINKTKS